MNLHVQVQPLSTGLLVRDYLAGRAPAVDFFSGHPGSIDAYARKLGEVSSRFDAARRARAAAALRPTTLAAAERLRQFVERGGAMVTTGQQAGLFGGPVYTIYKIVSAIQLARELEKRLGTLVLPVFWVASEDHDWDEVNHTRVVDREMQLRLLAVDSPQRLPLPIGERTFGPSLEYALGGMGEAVAGKAFEAQCMRALRGAYAVGAPVAGAFREWVHQTFSACDLLTTDAADPALKAASAPVLAAAAENALEREMAVRQRTDELHAAGYSTQVPILPGASNVFLHGPAGRERLEHEKEHWLAPLSRQRFTTGELTRRIREEPEQFSPNVLLRPVVESAVFPTLAYVGGPGELAYLAQAQPLFARAGFLMPVAYPRLSATLVPEQVQSILDRWRIRLPDAFVPRHELLARLARWSLPSATAGAFAELRRAIVARYAGVMEAVSEFDLTTATALGAERDRALLGVATGEQKVLRALKRGDPRLSREVSAVHGVLYPTNAPQERVLNAVPFLATDERLLQRLGALVPMPDDWALPRHAG